jgi:hypothetical protein
MKGIDPDVIKDIVYGIILAAGLWFKSWKDRKNTKKDNEALRLQMLEAALKLAETHKEQLEKDAKQLRDELTDAAKKLAEQAERQLQEKLRLEAEEKKAREARTGIEVNERMDREVRHAEQKILNEYKAQRMYIIHFSNGVVTEAGIHLMKITFESEIVERYDVEKIARFFKEKPIPEMFKSPVRLSLAGEYHYIPDVEAMEHADPNRMDYFNWLSAYRVKSVLWIPLRNNSGKVVAIMVSHWFARTHFDERDIAKIKDMKNDIEGIYDAIRH